MKILVKAVKLILSIPFLLIGVAAGFACRAIRGGFYAGWRDNFWLGLDDK